MTLHEKRLKILFIAGWYPSKNNEISGIFVKEHAKAVSLYNDVTVFYSEGINHSINKLYKVEDNMEDGIRTLRLCYRKSPIAKTTYFIHLWSILRVFHELRHKGWKPDIIHAHVFLAGVPAVILGKIYKIPVVITEHWSGFPRRMLGKLDLIKARFALNRVKIVLPVSKNLESSIKSYGINNRFEVIYNVVDIHTFYPSLKKGINKIKKILLVALLLPVKGIPYLLQSLAQLKQKRQDFSLEIVGDGPNREEYEKLTMELDLEKEVKFYGLRSKSEIAEFMRNSDFFVLPSLWENLPCVLIEAMASGLPVIASNVGGIPEILNKENGILIPSKNINALSEGIDYMLDHYREYSSDKISQYAKDRFSYETVGLKLDKIYNRVLYEKNTVK